MAAKKKAAKKAATVAPVEAPFPERAQAFQSAVQALEKQHGVSLAARHLRGPRGELAYTKDGQAIFEIVCVPMP